MVVTAWCLLQVLLKPELSKQLQDANEALAMFEMDATLENHKAALSAVVKLTAGAPPSMRAVVVEHMRQLKEAATKGSMAAGDVVKEVEAVCRQLAVIAAERQRQAGPAATFGQHSGSLDLARSSSKSNKHRMEPDGKVGLLSVPVRCNCACGCSGGHKCRQSRKGPSGFCRGRQLVACCVMAKRHSHAHHVYQHCTTLHGPSHQSHEDHMSMLKGYSPGLSWMHIILLVLFAATHHHQEKRCRQAKVLALSCMDAGTARRKEAEDEHQALSAGAGWRGEGMQLGYSCFLLEANSAWLFPRMLAHPMCSPLCIAGNYPHWYVLIA